LMHGVTIIPHLPLEFDVVKLAERILIAMMDT